MTVVTMAWNYRRKYLKQSPVSPQRSDRRCDCISQRQECCYSVQDVLPGSRINPREPGAGGQSLFHLHPGSERVLVQSATTQTVPGYDNSRIFHRCAVARLARSGRSIIAQCCVNLKQRGESSFQFGPVFCSNNTQTPRSGGYFSSLISHQLTRENIYTQSQAGLRISVNFQFYCFNKAKKFSSNWAG